MRCFLTCDTRLARAELLGEVDIEAHAHTKRQRGCCSGRQYSHRGCVTVDPWERHRPRHS